eukprot:12923515-Prorocentrum_lima.AAC.1
MLEYVVSTLLEDTQLIKQVYDLMRGGVFKEQLKKSVDPVERFHRSAVRWCDLSGQTLLQLIHDMEPGLDLRA